MRVLHDRAGLIVRIGLGDGETLIVRRRDTAVRRRRLHDAVEHVIDIDGILRGTGGGEKRPAQLLHAPEAVVLAHRADRAAVEALGVAADLAIQRIEIDDGDWPIHRVIGGKWRRRDAIDCATDAGLAAAAEVIRVRRLVAVGPDFLRLTAEVVVVKVGGVTVGIEVVRHPAGREVMLPSVGLVQRIRRAGDELAARIVSRAGLARGETVARLRYRQLVAEGIVGRVGLQLQRRRAGLDRFLREQAGARIIGKTRVARDARLRQRRAGPCRANTQCKDRCRPLHLKPPEI